MAPREVDPRAAIVDEETFTLIADLEVRKAVRLQYYVSLLAIQPEVEGAVTGHDLRNLAYQVADVISAEIRGSDVIGLMRTSPHLQVLLVSAHLYNLPLIIERITRAVSTHAFVADSRSVPVTLSVGGACFPTTARLREELFMQAASLTAQAQQERRGGHRYRLAQGGL
jgi:hypothetical protein